MTRSIRSGLLLCATTAALAACGGDRSPTSPVSTIRPATNAPAALQLVAGDAQTAPAGTPVLVPPSIRVVNAAGVPMADVLVLFTPAPGAGTVSGGSVRTDANGVATVGSWTLGPTTAPSTQQLVASSTTLAGRAITFRATATPNAFTIAVRFVGDGGTERQRQAFTTAAARWSRVIVGDIGTTPLNVPAGECESWIPAVKESVRNLLVFVRIAAIDGPAKVVAQASPCYVNSSSHLPIMGFFELDQDDLALMTDRGLLDDVVVHEMGHILGIGTLWNYQRTLLVGSGGDDPHFTGLSTRDAFAIIGGGGFAGNVVPVENSGSVGTRDAHWRRSVFGNELMQGFAQPGGMPLSRVTAASLQDLGYVVSMAGIDSYSLVRAALRVDGTSTTGGGAAIAFGDDVARAPLYEVTTTGQRRLVRPELE